MKVKPGTLVFLDAGVLSLLAHPRGGDEARRARAWARTLLQAGVRLFVAQVSDYEVRRELIRLRATASLRELDKLRGTLDFAPSSPPVYDLAAQLWAESRQRGQPTCSPLSLDADTMLAAQALTVATPDRAVVIASPNTRHLAQFLAVEPWQTIEIFSPVPPAPPLNLLSI